MLAGGVLSKRFLRSHDATQENLSRTAMDDQDP